MRIFHQRENCQACKGRCDIYFTAKELGCSDDYNPQHVNFRKHEAIVSQNEDIRNAIILLEGHAKIYIEGLNGRNIMLGLIVPGNYLGLMSVFGTSQFPYHVRALTDVRCCMVDIVFLNHLYQSDKSFQLRLNEQFGQSVRSIMAKLVSLNQKQLRARMAESLLYLSGVFDAYKFRLTLTRNDLGELAGITGENAVRVLGDFRNEGIIRLQGKELELILPDMLRKISAAG